MNRSISLLVCLLMGVAMCGCQTTQNAVRLGECPLKVEALAPGVAGVISTVAINGMNVGNTYPNPSPDGAGVFGIKLAPGNYLVTVTTPGFETYKETVTLLGKENEAILRFRMKPIKTGTEK